MSNKLLLYFYLLFLLLLFNSTVYGMPAFNGTSEPNPPAGVNQPDPWSPSRDDADLEGEWNVLVILVDFEDYPWDFQGDENFNNEGTPYSQDHFREMLFSDVNDGEGFAHPGSESEYTGSMRDYYNEVSGGLFTVTGLVTEWVRAPEPYSYYCNGDGEFDTEDDFGYRPYPENVQGLVETLLGLVDDDVDFSDFDNDDNGTMDALTIVHAGPGAENFGRNAVGANYFWSHKWSIWDQEYDGVTISTYNITPQSGTIGVFCHEFGHVLGLPDLYDIDYSSQGIGEWGLMAGGGWPNRPGDPPGSCPIHMCGWSKMMLGWVEVVNIDRPMENVGISPVIEDGVIHRVWTDGEDDSQEYFLLENRQPIGFDEGLLRRQVAFDLPSPEGLLVTHIDMIRFGQGNQDNADEEHRLVDVEEASPVWIGGEPVENLDFTGGSNRNLYNSNRGDNGDLWPGFSEISEDSTDWIGDRDRDRFGIVTTPSSANYQNEPSLVEVYDIYFEDDWVFASFSMTAPQQPLLQITDDSAEEGENSNHNGAIEPGEDVEWSITLHNLGLDEATGVYAILAYMGDNDWIDITGNEMVIPDIPGREDRDGEEPFFIQVSEDAPYGEDLNFEITINCNDGLEFTYQLTGELNPPHDWYKYPNNPVFGGDEDVWDPGIISPSLLVEDGLLKCWYVGVSIGGNQEGPPPGAIGYTTSEDGGFTWERRDEPILTIDNVEWAASGFGGIAVIPSVDGGYLMAFVASPDQIGNENLIGLAHSDDGIEWEVEDESIIEPDFQQFFGIFPTQLSLFLLPFPPYPLSCAFTAIAGMGAPAIGSAFSEDGVDWEIDPNFVLLPSDNVGRFDALATLAPDVTYDIPEESIRMLYTGMGIDEVMRLGLVHIDPDGIDHYNGPETWGAILEPDEDDWDGVNMIFGARYFEWEGEPRLLYIGASDDEENGSAYLGLAAAVPFNEESAPLFDRPDNLPREVELESVYPNPFNSTTSIKYRIAKSGRVSITIHDITGREIVSLMDDHITAGQHEINWDGCNYKGFAVASGFYIVKVSSNGNTVRGKLMLIK